jgi:hypothetical protein
VYILYEFCSNHKPRKTRLAPTTPWSQAPTSHLSSMSLPDGIQEHIESIEDYIYVSYSSAMAQMPNIQEALNRLWADVARFGPAIPEIHLPVLIEVPPPPPPPPPPPVPPLENVMDWAFDNPWKASSLGVGVVGMGLLVGYSAYRAKSQSRSHRRYHAASHERRQVVGTHRLW